MCGIVGFLGRTAESGSDAAIVRHMADLIRHRGPDGDGVWSDPDAEIAFAHRRLAIIDLSPAGQQPMISASGRYVLTFNGEIYNWRELRATLDAQGAHQWRGHSDTEVLLEAIVSWGLARALRASVGMFALALWDRQERVLQLARDRIGEKPLYYGRVGKSFIFGSELAAFRGYPAWAPEIDRGALALLMRHNYVPAPYSIYKGIFKLHPGQLLSVTRTTEPKLETYWSAREAAERGSAEPFRGSPAEAVDQLEMLLKQSIKGQMVADVPLGAFLSGGVDSSAIVALMQSMSSRPVRTFTIGFEQAEYNEAQHAKAVAAHLGTDHTELYVTERDAMETVSRLPTIYSEPFSDSSQIPTFLVSELARRNVAVSLSGDGGDELFSGYTRYGIIDDFWCRLNRFPLPLRQAGAHLARLPSPRFYDRVAGRLKPLLPLRYRYSQFGDKVYKAAGIFTLASPAAVYRQLCSHWTNPNSLVLGAEEPPTMLTGLEDLPEFATNIERMMYLDLTNYLPDDILVKVDRASMGVSLESRVPLLDHRVVEFASSLPLSIARHEGKTKWPLRQVLYRHVPKALIERPKTGFGVPIDSWLRNGLRDWAEDLLSECRLRQDGFFNADMVRSAWLDHLSGRHNHHYLLWDVLMFHAWYDHSRQVGQVSAA